MDHYSRLTTFPEAGARQPRARVDTLPVGAVRRVAILGNHLPRQCGIATFTTHLGAAITEAYPTIDTFVLAMNDHEYAYPENVRFSIGQGDVGAYRRAADFLNVNTVDLVCVQHEYGIFGGRAGAHVLGLLRDLRMPIVTTLHTILKAPSEEQRATLTEIAELSQRVVVMSAYGATLLHDVYDVPAAKICRIPHGIPSVPPDGKASKHRLGVDGRFVVLTFGLLSPDKGIEQVIDALPAVVAEHPETIYIVLGATHPHVKAQQGETYRLMLEQRARSLGVDANLVFHDRFVSQDELNEFLSAADVYITPYKQPEQIVSGTLAYAVGSGRAVISTPYAYAKELLANDRGVLVPWADPAAIGRALSHLITDEPRRDALRARAANYGRNMLWPQVARQYIECFEEAAVEHADRRREAFHLRTVAQQPASLPDVNLEHLALMTDHTGLLQHAHFAVPRYDDGYCLDDNARALRLMTLLEEASGPADQSTRALTARYLAFVSHAFNRTGGRFRNFMAFTHEWLETSGSEDSHGRAVWALGTVLSRSMSQGHQNLARELFQHALPVVDAFTSPRAWAFVLLGLDEYLHAFGGDMGAQQLRRRLAERLLDSYRRTSSRDWPWFEDELAYCNARLSQALIVSGDRMGDLEMTTAGLDSLAWLASIQVSPDGCFAPVGSNGFGHRRTAIAVYDQQPVEAGSMIAACLEALSVTGESRWAQHAQLAFGWFIGHNHLQESVYDAATGGCRDGLHVDRANQNEGAESTLAFLIALVEMRAANARGAFTAPEAA